MKALRFISLTVFLLVVVVTSFQSQAKAQSGWYPIKTPTAVSDFDALNDSVIAAYEGSGKTEVSFDGGKSWIVRASAPRDSAFSTYQIKIISPTNLRIFGAVNRTISNATFEDYLGDSRDTGKSWVAQIVDDRDGYGYGIVRHEVQRWYYRDDFPIQPILAPTVWNGKTGKTVWSSFKYNAPELDILDSEGIAAAYFFNAPSAVLLRTTNSGVSWDSVPNIVPSRLNSFGPVHAVSHALWCVAVENRLLRSTDSGKSWNTVAECSSTISDFGFFDSTGYLVPQGADYVEKSTDGGATWFAQSTGNTSMNFVIPTSTQSAYLSGNTSTIMHLSDGGIRGPVLSIQRLIDFGKIHPDTSHMIAVLARNLGSDTLRVTGYDVDNSFVTTIAPGSFALAPGDSLRVTVSSKVTAHSFDTAHVHFHTNSLPQLQEVEIRAASNDSLSGVQAEAVAEPLHLTLLKNPWSDASTLSILPASTDQSRIRICDLLGRSWLDESSSSSSYKLRASDLPSGFYVIEVDRKNSAPSRINMIHH